MNIEDEMRLMKTWSFPEKEMKKRVGKTKTKTQQQQYPCGESMVPRGKLHLRNERPLLPLVKQNKTNKRTKIDFYFKYSWNH